MRFEVQESEPGFVIVWRNDEAVHGPPLGRTRRQVNREFLEWMAAGLNNPVKRPHYEYCLRLLCRYEHAV